MTERRNSTRGDTSLSDGLRGWFASEGPKSIGGLLDHFGHQTFALAFLLLLAPSALPLPTGGITNIFEGIAILLAVQLVLGRDEPWLPRRLQDRQLKSLSSEKTQARLLAPIQKVEKLARPRMERTLHSGPGRIVFGLIVIVLASASFISPPFSGLDTLPAMGVVVVSLGVLFGDAIIVGVGVVVGAGGIGLMIALAGAITAAFGRMF